MKIRVVVEDARSVARRIDRHLHDWWATAMSNVHTASAPARMGDWVLTADGWRHRPLWKFIANTVLRLVQPQARKWVFYTVCEGEDRRSCPPRVVRYGFGRILHERAR